MPNTFSGGYKGFGTLIIGHDQALGTGTVWAGSPGSGNPIFQAGNGNRTIRNPIAPTGGNAFSMTLAGTNNLTLAGGAGTGTVGGNGITFTVGNPVLTVNRPLFAYVGPPAYALTKNGTGTLVLNESSPAQMANNGVNINAGALIANGSTVAQSVLTGNTTNGSAVITGLSSTAGLRVGQQVSGSGAPGSYPVVVSIDSASQVTLAQAWTSSGSPSLTFSAVGALGYNTGNITVAAGATLGGRGTIVMGSGKKATLNAGTGTAPANWGGILSPGASAGTLTITGDMDISSYAAYLFDPADIAANSDKVAVTGALAFLSSPTVIVKLASMVGDPTGQSYTLFTYGTTSGTPAWFLDTSGTGWTGGSIAPSGNSFVLSGMVPEPTALALQALAAGVSLARRRW